MPSVARPKSFLGGPPLIKILDPPLTSYKKNPQKPSLARAPTTGLGPGALAPPAPPLSTPLPMAARVEVNHHDIRLEDIGFSVQCQRLYQKHCKPH